MATVDPPKARLGGCGGLSLVELMVAVTIAAILAAIALPMYQRFVNKAKMAEGEAAVVDVRTLEQQYYVSTHSYTTDLAALGYSPTPPLKYYDVEVVLGDTAPGSVPYQIVATPKVPNLEAWYLTMNGDGTELLWHEPYAVSSASGSGADSAAGGDGSVAASGGGSGGAGSGSGSGGSGGGSSSGSDSAASTTAASGSDSPGSASASAASASGGSAGAASSGASSAASGVSASGSGSSSGSAAGSGSSGGNSATVSAPTPDPAPAAASSSSDDTPEKKPKKPKKIHDPPGLATAPGQNR